MINIKVNNEYLDLFADTKVSVNYSNKTSASSDGAHVTYSDNVEIPLTKRNSEILGIDVDSGITPTGIIIGVVEKGYSHIMDISIEVQSVKYNDLENTITLLVMDAVSGIFKDLKNKKMDIIFDEYKTDAYYLKRASVNVDNSIYKYGFVDTTGYDENVNASNRNIYSFVSRADNTAIPRMVFNVNSCIKNIFSKYGINSDSFRDIVDDDIYTTLPYEDLSPLKESAESMFIPQYNSGNSKIQMPVRNRDDINDEHTNSLILNRCGNRAFYPNVKTAIDYDELNNYYLSGDSKYVLSNMVFSKYYCDREIYIKPLISGFNNCKVEVYKDTGSGSRSNFAISHISNKTVILSITVRRESSKIESEFKVARLFINSYGKVTDYEMLNEYIHQEAIKIKAGESVHIGYSFMFESNGYIYAYNGSESYYIPIGRFGAEVNALDKSIGLFVTLDVGFSDIGSMIRPTNDGKNIKSNLILSPVKKTDKYCVNSFDKYKLSSFMKDCATSGYNQRTLQRDCVDVASSLYASETTAYDFISEVCSRFNIKMSIVNSSIVNSSASTDCISISDRINSNITLTPKKYDSEIKDFSIKNKDYNSMIDKLWDGRGSFDSDVVVISNDNEKSNNISLKASPIPDFVTGKPYVIDDDTVELVNKYGMVAVGVTQLNTTERSNMSFRFGYFLKYNDSDNIITGLYPISRHAEYDCENISQTGATPELPLDKNFYTSEFHLNLISPVDNRTMRYDRSGSFPINAEFTYESQKTQLTLTARLNDGILVVDFPHQRDNNGDLITSGTLELFTSECNDLQYVESMSGNGTPIYGTLNYLMSTNASIFFKKIYIYEQGDNNLIKSAVRFELNKNQALTSETYNINGNLRISFRGISDPPNLEPDKNNMMSVDRSERICIPVYTKYAVNNPIAKSSVKSVFINPSIPDMDNYLDMPDVFTPIIGITAMPSFKSYNTTYSLSFNDDLSNGKINAVDRYFRSYIDGLKFNSNPYIELEIMVTTDESGRILAGANIDIHGVVYEIIEASDMDLGENCLVKIKIVKK